MRGQNCVFCALQCKKIVPFAYYIGLIPHRFPGILPLLYSICSSTREAGHLRRHRRSRGWPPAGSVQDRAEPISHLHGPRRWALLSLAICCKWSLCCWNSVMQYEQYFRRPRAHHRVDPRSDHSHGSGSNQVGFLFYLGSCMFSKGRWLLSSKTRGKEGGF